MPVTEDTADQDQAVDPQHVRQTALAWVNGLRVFHHLTRLEDFGAGLQHSADLCPLALAACGLVDDIYVNSQGIHSWGESGETTLVYDATPEVSDFVLLFDEGAYPDLIVPAEHGE